MLPSLPMTPPESLEVFSGMLRGEAGQSQDTEIKVGNAPSEDGSNDVELKVVSDEAKDLIAKLLVVDPKKRLSAGDALQHTWFKIQDEKRSKGGET